VNFFGRAATLRPAFPISGMSAHCVADSPPNCSMKTLLLQTALFILLSALGATTLHAQNGVARTSDPVVGCWHWFSNELVYIQPDGTLTKGGPVVGKWQCTHPTQVPRKYVLIWGNGVWVDTLALQANASFLEGRNQIGHRVSGARNLIADQPNGDAPAGSGAVAGAAIPSGATRVVLPPGRVVPAHPPVGRVPHIPAAPIVPPAPVQRPVLVPPQRLLRKLGRTLPSTPEPAPPIACSWHYPLSSRRLRALSA